MTNRVKMHARIRYAKEGMSPEDYAFNKRSALDKRRRLRKQKRKRKAHRANAERREANKAAGG